MKKFTLMAALIFSAASANAEGDPAKGERVFKKCAACHSADPDQKKTGPHLNGILGRNAGAIEGFKYSKRMSEADLVWNEENLRQFLASPKTFIPKTKMSFPGIKNEDDLGDLIAYLAGL
ncbi:cytochrome c family protein [Rhodobacteraceae bacterium]|nr:cytochrome c family protein [Paracoccaceae bacterium]